MLDVWGEKKLSINLIEMWPSTLKAQLTASGSHEPLVLSLGEKKTVIGVFEIFSRTPLPKGLKPVMSQIPITGSKKIDARLVDSSSGSTSLAGYSLVVVTKALDLLSASERSATQVRRLIHECMHEVLKLDQLVHDITTAATSLARLNAFNSQPKSEKSNLPAQTDLKINPDFNFESLTDRPQDWRSSHWWTGE